MARPPNTSFRRQQIVLALVRLLAREGAGAVSMAALAKESGLAQGLLHYHFKDRSQMLQGAVAELESRLLAQVARAVAGARDEQEELDAWLSAMLSVDLGDGEAMAAWVAIGTAAQDDPVLRDLVGKTLERLVRPLRAATTERPEGTAELLIAAAEGAWRLGVLRPGFLPAGSALPALRAMLGLSPSTEPRAERVFRALREISPVSLEDAAWSELQAAWTEPGRVHHDVEHLLDLGLLWLDLAMEGRFTEAGQTWLAVLFHDAVYRPGATDNEERSAALLLRHQPGARRAAELIRLTAQHGRLDRAALDEDARLFLDADMAVLGAPLARYRRYAAGIRAEYAPVVGEAAFNKARVVFLETLLDSRRIYLSDRFRDRLEAQARINLQAERDGTL